ncbi:MAG: cation diffusion facilitator family transporter [Candidatus Methanomethylophilaceae archaeon]
MENEKQQTRGRKLLLSLLLNLIITIAQVIGGLVSGSLALLSDALHNLTDVVAIIISWVAVRISRKECSPDKTFGTRRAELFAALINGVILIGISLYILIEALERISYPPTIDSMIVIVLGAAAVVINGICAYMFHSDAKESLNIRSVYLNLLTDMFTSVAVLAGGLLMLYYGLFWVDIVITVVISGALIYSAIGLVRESIRIFMLYTPEDIDPFEVENAIIALGHIKGVHHMHIWQLVEDEVHLEAHLEFFQDLSISVADDILDEVQDLLCQRFGITHVTLQPEFGRDDAKDLIMPLEGTDHSQADGQRD